MNDLQSSKLWYRVADLKPEIRQNIQSYRHEYRQTHWYIFRDDTSGKHHRFNLMTYQLISLMNGQNSLMKIWELMQEKYDDTTPGQDEIIQLVGQLHSEEIIQCGISPDNAELFEQHQKLRLSKWKNAFLNPLSLRIPMLNPNGLLDHILPSTRFIFTKSFLFIWALVITTAIVLSLQHLPEITENSIDRILTTHNLLIIALLYPLLKLFHELGHALVTKHYGGEVKEMGIMLLALIPNPYVDTTSSWSFYDKKQRILVSAAGMMTEFFLASLALFVWLMVEPGIVSAIAFNTMLIASITTLFFNANPLLKFDGYFILSDLIEIPNLASRSNKYIAYLIQRYLFGLKTYKNPTSAKGESKWFFTYAILAFLYRNFILAVIVLFIASKFLFIGMLLAVWVITTQVIFPILKQTNFLLTNPVLSHKRHRAILVSSSITFSLVFVIFFIPVPNTTLAQGVISTPDKSEIRVEATGFVSEVLIEDGSFVKPDTPLLKIHDPDLAFEEKILRSKLKQLELKLASVIQDDRIKANALEDDISSIRNELNHINDKKNNLIIKSKQEGIFSLLEKKDLKDHYLQRGKLIAYVISSDKIVANVVVPQKDMEEINSVSIKLTNDISNSIPAKIIRETPASSYQLPSPVLGTLGGGSFATNPQDKKGIQTIDPVFHFDIELNNTSNIKNYIGSRVYAKFTHDKKPLAERWYRSLRQLFLTQFDI